MIATIYVGRDKSSNYEEGKRLGLTGEALEMFVYACYEVALGIDVDETTGKVTIISVDGRKVEP
jgi:hypothetical protein